MEMHMTECSLLFQILINISSCHNHSTRMLNKVRKQARIKVCNCIGMRESCCAWWKAGMSTGPFAGLHQALWGSRAEIFIDREESLTATGVNDHGHTCSYMLFHTCSCMFHAFPVCVLHRVCIVSYMCIWFICVLILFICFHMFLS